MSFQLGRSALMVAVQNKRRDVAALLLSAGANPDLQEEVRGAVGVCAIGPEGCVYCCSGVFPLCLLPICLLPFCLLLYNIVPLCLLHISVPKCLLPKMPTTYIIILKYYIHQNVPPNQRTLAFFKLLVISLPVISRAIKGGVHLSLFIHHHLLELLLLLLLLLRPTYYYQCF